tara:strand:- start:457 stop:930 length:474 start_codon:yes stop_codon:yes gene_type:complete
MAHFAKISENNEVLTVLVIDNSQTADSDGVEDESVGQQYLETHHSWPAEKWIQTSYNTTTNTHSSGDNSKAFRGNYAGVGYLWDPDNNIFWRPKPYASWVKNTSTAKWDSPLGNATSLTDEQSSQNSANTHDWYYSWDESAYQSNNSTGWVLVDRKA